MRVALNLMFVAPGVAGGRVYAEGLLRGLAAVDDKNEYVLYTRRDTVLPELPAPRFHQHRAPVSGGSAVWRTIWEYGLLPREVRRSGCQLLHGLGGLPPSSRSCPFVLTIHDLIYRDFPGSVPLGQRLFMRCMHAKAARKADRILVYSRWTARQVVERLGGREDRLRLVRLGPGQGFGPVEDAGHIDSVLRRHGVGRPYIISVCRAYHHKNLAGLLRTFALIRQQGRQDLQLVLVGERYQSGSELDWLGCELGLGPALVFPGFVLQQDLNALYCGAAAFAFPSLAEGFGLPVLEAMACGVPVAASNAAAIPEVVAEGGLLADARDPSAFAASLIKC